MLQKNLEKLDKFTDYFSAMAEKVISESERTPEEVRELATMANEAANYIRELYQESVCSEVKELQRQLMSGRELDEDQKELLRNMIVSDAREYIKEETAFASWLNDLKSLSDSIKKIDSKNEDPDYLLSLYGKSLVLKRITQDLNFYYEQKKRADLFAQNTGDGIDANEARVLIDTLKFKLENPDN